MVDVNTPAYRAILWLIAASVALVAIIENS